MKDEAEVIKMIQMIELAGEKDSDFKAGVLFGLKSVLM